MVLDINQTDDDRATDINRRKVLKASGAGFFAPFMLDEQNTKQVGKTLFIEIGVIHSIDKKVNPRHIDQLSFHSVSDDNQTLYVYPINSDMKSNFERYEAIQSADEYRSIPGQTFGRSRQREVYLSYTSQNEPYEVLPIQSPYYLPPIHASKGESEGAISIEVEGNMTTVGPRSESKIKLNSRQIMVQTNYLNNPSQKNESVGVQPASVTPIIKIDNFGNLETRVVDHD